MQIKGFTFVEAVIVVGILAVFGVMLSRSVVDIHRNNHEMRTRLIAQQYALEGLDALHGIAAQRYGSLRPSVTAYGLATDADVWTLDSDAANDIAPAPFDRTITLSDALRDGGGELTGPPGSIDVHTTLATIDVSWAALNGDVRSYAFTDLPVTNWNRRDWHHDTVAELSGTTSSTTIVNNSGGEVELTETSPGVYASTGTYVSPVLTPADTASLATIQWDATSCGSCSVELRVRSADTVAALLASTWEGPDGRDGDATDFFSDGNGERIWDHVDDEYFQYQVTLAGDTTETPSVDYIWMTYADL